MPKANAGPDPVRPGHWRALAMLADTDALVETRARYRAALGSEVYLRPTDKGLTVIGLDRSAPGMAGVGGRESGQEYLVSLPPSPGTVASAVDGYRMKVAGMRRRSVEERFALGLIRQALEGELVLPGSDLLFLCQEWRLPSGGRIDLLAVDPDSGQLVVIELKGDGGSTGSALTQARDYAREVEEYAVLLLRFFDQLAAAMGAGYRRWSMPQIGPEAEVGVEVWWPSGRTPRSGSGGPPRGAGPSGPSGESSRSGGSGSPTPGLEPVPIEVLRAHHVHVSSDSPLQQRARLLQARWREDQGLPIGAHRGRPLGSRLAMPAAEIEGWNSLTPEIAALVREEYETNRQMRDRRFRKLIGHPRIFEDLLSSQPMCFNLFGPWALDLDLATAVARRLWPDRVERVTGVEFEFSPGRWDPAYLDNGTAADVLLRHTTPTGGQGVIGIETKYHEDLSGEPARHKARYEEVAAASGAFRDVDLSGLQSPPLQQIWLDHLLVLAMKATDGLDSVLHLLVHPRDNAAVAEAAEAYAEQVVDGSFQSLALEEVCDAVAVEDPGHAQAFRHRYLAFDRLEALEVSGG